MSSHWLTFIEIVVLLGLNAFFVAAEFALVKARAMRLEALADASTFGARLTVRIQRQLEPYLAACQLGITMASLGLGWVGEPAAEALLSPLFAIFELPPQSVHTISFLTGFLLFSSLHIVIGEQVPKTFAIRKAEPVSVALAYPLQFFYILMYPLNWLLNRASGAILALFGVQEATHGEVYTSEELRNMVSSSSEHGSIGENQAQMLANLFAFDERTVGRVMIPRGDVAIIDLAADLETNVAALVESGHSRFPVVDGRGDLPLGVLLVKEFYREMIPSGQIPWDRIRELLRPPMVVPETMRIGKVFESMREKREHMVLVVDEYGTFVGIVTLEDIIEEIVGDIDDELDETGMKYTIEMADNGWICDGLLPLADVERATGLVVPDDLNANTLSGLFLQRLARMPVPGDIVEEPGYLLQVLRVTDHHVEKVRIERDGANTAAAQADGGGEPQA